MHESESESTKFVRRSIEGEAKESRVLFSPGVGVVEPKNDRIRQLKCIQMLNSKNRANIRSE